MPGAEGPGCGGNCPRAAVRRGVLRVLTRGAGGFGQYGVPPAQLLPGEGEGCPRESRASRESVPEAGTLPRIPPPDKKARPLARRGDSD